MVQPGAPKARDARFRNRHAAEQRERDDDEGVDQAGDEARRRHRRDHLSHRHGKHLRDQHHEELISGPGGLVAESGQVVDGDEEAQRAEQAVRYLGADHCEREWELRICFCGGLAVEDQAREVVHGFHLREDQRRDDRDLEDHEHAVL